MKQLHALTMVIFSVLACQSGRDEGVSDTSAPEPGAVSETGEYTEQADEVIRALQSGLVGALTAAMKEGGAAAAVHVLFLVGL